MFEPQFDTLAAPVLAVDCAATRALCYRPGLAPEAWPLLTPPPDQGDLTPDWHALVAQAGLERPEAVLFAYDAGRAHREAALARAFTDHATPAAPNHGLALPDLPPAAEPGDLRLAAIQRMTDYPVQDSGLVWIPGLLALPAIARRSWRLGVTLLHLDSRGLRAALVYQEKLFALLELPVRAFLDPAGAVDAPALSARLEDFRLGWLPPELAQELGGFVQRAPELPPEAEGFGPSWVCGADAARLDGFGQHLPVSLPLVCWGLLHRYALGPVNTKALLPSGFVRKSFYSGRVP
jgi:hypothetical protein